MKRLYLIRHAKSKWSNPDLDDFDRPLNRRGKEDSPKMAARLAAAGIRPDLIVASPAKRARRTAVNMARGTGYRRGDIHFYKELYLGDFTYHLQLIEELLQQVDVLFLVGHNPTMTELGEHLTGRYFGNVPTCGIVAVEYPQPEGFVAESGAGTLLFFDYPKKSNESRGQ